MVLGLRSKNKKGASVQVEYTIHIQEIKPWPPSQSLKSLRSVILQWVNGDRRSGSMGPVTPSLSEGKIEFNESFKLQVVLLKDTSVKGNDFVAFQKNVLELNLYEPRRDRTAKGQLLGTALIDLAEHGLIKEAVRISIPVNSKRSFRNTAQPVLYVKIQRFDEEGGSSSSRESLSKEASLEKDGRESVSALMTEEYAEEAEIASFTDDDVSSHSSFTNSSSALEAAADMPVQNGGGEVEKDKNISEAVEESREAGAVHSSFPVDSPPPKPDLKQESATFVLHGVANHPTSGGLPQSASSELTSDSGILDGDCPENILAANTQNYENLTIHPYSSTVTSEVKEEGTASLKPKEDVDRTDSVQEAEETINNSRGDEHAAEKPTEDDLNLCGRLNQVGSSVDRQNEKLNGGSISEAVHSVDQVEKSKESRNVSEQVDSSNHNIVVEESLERKQIKTNSEESVQEVRDHSSNGECLAEDLSGKPSIASPTGFTQTPPYQQQSYLQNDFKPLLPSYRNTSSRRFRGENGNRSFVNEKLRNLKFSVRSQSESFGSIAFTNDNQYEEEVKEIDVQEDVRDGGKNLMTDDGIDDQESTSSSSDKVKRNSKNQKDTMLDEKIHELELRVEMLEEELREAAAIEIGLYSVVAEHGSSVQKVHTPARRLSRLYIHASRYWSRERRATTARSAVSGLVMAAKTCGNDVPRLSFWLSNSVVLRAIITQTSGHQDLPTSASPYHAADASQIVPRNKSSPLKWESSTRKKDYSLAEEYEDWEDPNTFITALERIESWIFSRIIESIWWQTLTPHMQSVNEAGDPKMGSRSKKTYARRPSLVDQEQANLSIEIWKRAFRDACGRLCPVRAEGHECGCLPILARLVMEQCIARLDVAMFNAILRESDDEIPTDPVSDPISDSKVLPIPSGKSSFGAGAQLKNAIGNWSRWLTDLFGIDTDDFHEDDNQHEDDRMDVAETFKSFHLLNALSDLLMLPKDMLLESSIRKEVCPTFSASMIKRILESFQPDEFCPDPIPHEVFEALDSEDPHDNSKDRITSFPCSASSIIYSPPPVASVEAIIGDVRSASSLRRSGSSVVRKCQTSDDELDELDSPLASIMSDKSFTPTGRPKGMGAGNAVRYQLLREVWRLDD